MNVVACFSGGIASGKTTLATAVSKRIGLPMASFGGYVRQVARARGIAENRDALQTLGAALIDEMTFDGFCRSVLEAGSWTSGAPIVVDGIRHIDAFDAVRRLVAPMPARLFFVDVPRAVRQARVADQRRGDGTDIVKADMHSTETEVHGALRDLAVLVLDGTRDVDVLVDDVAQFLGRVPA